MRLGALSRHWDRLGRRDPFWAVLTHPDKRHGGWDLEQFFSSGAAEITAALERAERLGLRVPRTRALDFGCGVGRLTQAMAQHFDKSDGVDISPSMLREARRHNRDPEHCAYHLNVASDLALFKDASFSFIYSTLVLQHMEPQYSKGYIRELLRVLAPGGLLVFQLPSSRSRQEHSASASRSPVAGPLPPDAFRARLDAERVSEPVAAGEALTLSVTVENLSPHAWRALPDVRGRYQINLANSWLHADGELLQRDDGRSPLPHDLEPGSRLDVMIGITAPQWDGAYWLELDLVQEDISWFATQGSEPLRLPYRVVGGLAGPAPRLPKTALPPKVAVPLEIVPEIAAPPEPPFRERHPRIFRVLRVTRLRDVYWAWRHAVDDVKRRRDRVIVSMRGKGPHHLALPLIHWWKRGPFAPIMEMHCVPRSEVLAILKDGGGGVVDVEEELMGPFQSCRYWVVKE